MDLVPVEAPPTRMAAAGETLELLDAALRVVNASQPIQVVANQMVQTPSQGLSLLTGTHHDLIVDGKGHVHGAQPTCTQPLCQASIVLARLGSPHSFACSLAAMASCRFEPTVSGNSAAIIQSDPVGNGPPEARPHGPAPRSGLRRSFPKVSAPHRFGALTRSLGAAGEACLSLRPTNEPSAQARNQRCPGESA